MRTEATPPVPPDGRIPAWFCTRKTDGGPPAPASKDWRTATPSGSVSSRAVLALRPEPPQQLVLAAEFPSTAAACEAVC
ncbi:hypothetical protein, partial [Streptomyces lydicus]|uniref:hypothetical protein n=1 Tax=Streptomyces lydicus TaxID=47763 RepID=UPI0033217DBF